MSVTLDFDEPASAQESQTINSDLRGGDIENGNEKGKTKSRLVKRKSKLWQRTLTWFRRVHLYSGLVMFPWVMLYGFTAMLFNHPATLPDAKVVSTTATSSDDSTLAAELATAIVAQLNESGLESDATTPEDLGQNPTKPKRFKLVTPQTASFTGRSVWSFEDQDQRHTLVMNLNSMAGYVRTDENEQDRSDQSGPKDEAEQSWIEGGREQLVVSADPLVSAMRSAIDHANVLVEEKQLDVDAMRIPTLEFDVEVDGQTHRVRYDFESAQQRRGGRGRSASAARNSKPETNETSEEANSSPADTRRTGFISRVDAGEPRELSWRRYLLRLHTAHGYPVEQNSRWVWALIVDAMFLSMCFWGLSGLLMWWQLKKTRRLGLVFVSVSFVLALWLAVSMHAEMVS